MSHFASRRFWKAYRDLPEDVQLLAGRCYDLLEQNAQHPSLQLKKVGRFWSVRVGLHHRALAIPVADGFRWIWIGTHADYDRLIQK